MKTFFLVFVTFVICQLFFRQYGTDNVITQACDACLGAIRWALRSALDTMK